MSITLLTSLILTNCGDNGGTNPEPTKTLVKEKLYDKDWYNQGSISPTHIFHPDGGYNSIGNGTWKWLNNSDSMEIVPSPGLNPQIWYFEYCTDDEMACLAGKPREGESYTVFKTFAW